MATDSDDPFPETPDGTEAVDWSGVYKEPGQTVLDPDVLDAIQETAETATFQRKSRQDEPFLFFNNVFEDVGGILTAAAATERDTEMPTESAPVKTRPLDVTVDISEPLHVFIKQTRYTYNEFRELLFARSAPVQYLSLASFEDTAVEPGGSLAVVGHAAADQSVTTPPVLVVSRERLDRHTPAADETPPTDSDWFVLDIADAESAVDTTTISSGAGRARLPDALSLGIERVAHHLQRIEISHTLRHDPSMYHSDSA